MREICQINIQELYRCASEMEDYCAKHAEASPGLHVLFDASRCVHWPTALAMS
jgi:hypothetical protein